MSEQSGWAGSELVARVTRHDRDIDMGYRYGHRYGISDINEVSIWVSIWNMGYRYGIWYIDMVIHHIDIFILDIEMGCGISICEMTVSILSSWIST